MLTDKEEKRIKSLWGYGHKYREIAQDTLDGRYDPTYSEILKDVIECVKGIDM